MVFTSPPVIHPWSKQKVNFGQTSICKAFDLASWRNKQMASLTTEYMSFECDSAKSKCHSTAWLPLLPFAAGSMLPGYTIWPYNQSKNKYIVIALDLE